MTETWADRYEVGGVLGRGGEGQVRRGLDLEHGRAVALKVRSASSGAARERLLEETRLLVSIAPSAHLPLVRDDFFVGRKHVMVMDWIDGIDLNRALHQEGDPGFAPTVVFGWLDDLGRALDHLHEHDVPIVHGDVKPSNAVVANGGRIVLVDFGISGAVGQAGKRTGTTGFVAPEVVAGKPPSPAADVFSLAATAATLITGRPLTGERPAWAGVPTDVVQALERAIGAGLSVNPKRRPSSAGEFVALVRERVTTDLPSGIVTFVSADLPDLAWDEDAESAAAELVRADQLTADIVTKRGGLLPGGRPSGSSTIAAFPSAVSAVAASTDLLRRGGAPMRIGVHTGEAFARGGGYAGPALNIATALRDAAAAGQVVVSDTTARVVGTGSTEAGRLVPAGRVALAGGPRSVFVVDDPTLPGATAPLRAAVAAKRRLGLLVTCATITTAVALVAVFAATRSATTTDNLVAADLLPRTFSRPLLFASSIEGAIGVYRVDGPSAPPRRIGQFLGDDPTMSPDGTTIAFVGRGDQAGDAEIRVAGVDGEDLRRLTHHAGLDLQPAWSPQGDKLAFTSDRGSGYEIYVMDVARGDKGPLQPLTQSQTNVGEAAWSPDGAAIVFTTSVPGRGFDVYVANAAGRNQAGRQLTIHAGNDSQPAWSPDGKTIAFTSERDGSGQIYTMAAAGEAEGVRRLTDVTGAAGKPDWSPDGRSVVYMWDPPTVAAQPDVCVVAADTSRPGAARPLFATPTTNDHDVDW